MDIARSISGAVDKARLGGREHGARIVASGRILYVAAGSPAELDAFLRAVAVGAQCVLGAGAPPQLPPASARSDDFSPLASGSASPAGAWSGSVSGGGSSVAALREGFLQQRAGAVARGSGFVLPSSVDVDGPPEVGSELRVRGANLDNLCVAWFRLPGHGAPLPDVERDVSLDPALRFIPGATAQTYTVTPADVGLRLGCSVRPAAGGGGRWSVVAAPVTALDEAAPCVRLRLRGHTHGKYCDRRVRVCTAIGRYREGEVLDVVPRGSAAGAGGALVGGASVVWYRSAVLVAPDGAPGSAAAGDLAGLAFVRVAARPVADLPPAPPDYEPAPSLAAIKRSLALTGASAPEPAGGARAYPLFAADEGAMLVAALVPAGAAAPAAVFPYAAGARAAGVLALSLPVGPIEPAPPRAREIWIEGDARVGALLLGNVYYYGGSEGHSVVSWVAVGDDGETRDVKAPVRSAPPAAAPLPDAGAPPGAPGDAHPRALRVTRELEGCLIKFRVQPVRADGDEGYLESSRPSAEVVA